MDQIPKNTAPANQSGAQPFFRKFVAIVARVFAVILVIYSLYNLITILGFKYIFSDYYYFQSGSSLLPVFIFAAVMIVIFELVIFWAKKSQTKNPTSSSPQKKSLSSTINSYVGLIILFIVSFVAAKQPQYDIIYAYGSPQALNQILVQNQKIITGSNEDYVVYYYNFRRGMTYHKSTWTSNESFIGYSPHEFPHSNLNKLNIKSDSLVAPDGSQATVNLNSRECVIKVGSQILYSYGSLTKYSNCKVIGWIKPLW